MVHNSEAATGSVLKEEVFLEISQKKKEKSCARFAFLIILQACLQQKKKSDSVAVVFL